MFPENANLQFNPMATPNIPTFNFGMLPIQQPSRFTVFNWLKALNQSSINSVWEENCKTTEHMVNMARMMASAPIEIQRPAMDFQHEQRMKYLEEKEKEEQIRTISAGADIAEHQGRIEEHKVNEAIGYSKPENFDFDALDDDDKKLIMAVLAIKGKK